MGETGEIVVGVSTGGRASRIAVRWAAQRASATGSRLRLVHVIEGSIPATDDAELLLAAQTAARASLDEAADVAASVDRDLEVATELEQGSPVEVFDRLSQGADLLVVGSDWHGGQRASRRGVHSLRIAAGSHAPVAVIPDIDVSGRRGVVVGLDGSEASDAALAFAVSEAARLGEPLIAVHAWDIAMMIGGDYGYGVPMVPTDDLQRAAEEVLDEALAGVSSGAPASLEIQRVVVAGDPVIALAEEAASASLLVVGSHGRGALARFLLGSVSHGVLAHLEGPTVVVR
ncbi:universal stress protein [Agromyces sp. NPDC058484]|uniref:universal stress protein n=1 Tax=Agromyces sp. NPDC058484 TaxID=3346524 RepID=UPI0036652BFC